MAFGPEADIALNREASLAAEHIGLGATSLGKANYAAHALHAQAFFALSVGLERSCKLVLALDSMLRLGVYPTKQEIRSYGHQLRELLDAVDNLAAGRKLKAEHARLPRGEITDAIIATLTEFASNLTRYYNLELLAAGESGLAVEDPMKAWHDRVTARVLEAHYTAAQRERDERRAALLESMLGHMTVVGHVSESGEPIRTVGHGATAGLRTLAARPWERMYVLRLGRFLGVVLTAQVGALYTRGVGIPSLYEHYWIFQQTDRDFRTRKIWSNMR
jgi:hypothetical protein